MFALIRLGIFLLTRRWGLIVVGALLLVIGLGYGASSHHVSYQTIQNGTFTPYVVDDGNDYLQQNSGSTYYVVHEADFSPVFDGSQVFKNNSQTFVFVADTSSQDVDVNLTDGTHLSGTGYQVEKITTFDSSGQTTGTYTTSTYQNNPSGYDQNNWPVGILLSLLGLGLGALSILLPRRAGRLKPAKGASGFSVSPSAAMGMQGQGQPNAAPYANPYAQPGAYQQPNPYQNPYQSPAQYQQQNPYNPAQPANPYSVQPPAAPQYPSYPAGSYDKTQLASPPQPGSYDPTQRANPYNQLPQG